MQPAFELYTDVVDVWYAPLTVPAQDFHYLESILSSDEMYRARRFRFQKDREQYVVARGLLRVLLSRYVELEPQALWFCYGPFGKPFLPIESGRGKLEFNLSHSDGLVVFAVTWGRRVGIDVERLRPIRDGESLVERFFSEGEKGAFRGLPPERRQEAFFTCWTRKEAFIKARGEGLSFPLDGFDVPVLPEEPPRIASTRVDPFEASRWAMEAIRVREDYVGAVAAEGCDWHVRLRPLQLSVIQCEECVAM